MSDKRTKSNVSTSESSKSSDSKPTPDLTGRFSDREPKEQDICCGIFVLRIICMVLATILWFCYGFGYVFSGGVSAYLWFTSVFGFLVSVAFLLNILSLHYSFVSWDLVEMATQILTSVMYFISGVLLIRGALDLKKDCDNGLCYTSRHPVAAAAALTLLLMFLHGGIAVYNLWSFIYQRRHKISDKSKTPS